jgi:hypothetical protein
MAEWRISEENPVREDLQGFHFERCAALHNHILERGWTQQGLDPAQLERTTWWEVYDGDSTLLEIAERLDESLVSFLKLAWRGSSRAASNHAFHRIFSGLSSPSDLFDNALYNDYEDDEDKRQFVTLYGANWELASGHVLGLVVDQENFSSIPHISLEDSDITMNGRQGWVRLEEILEALLEMMDQGKVVAVDGSYSGRQETISGWIMPSFTEHDLEESLQGLDALIAAIEERLPVPPPKTGFEIGFIDPDDPETSAVFPPGTFARRFLERARKPRFAFLAPGLQIATSQPFASVAIEEDRLRPILLLQSSSRAYHDTFRTSWGEPYSVPHFHRDFGEIIDYPAGLYLTETKPYDVNPFEDGCKLVLPFAIGENSCVRTSDGAVFGEDKQTPGEIPTPTPTSSQLFQLGYNHFIKSHNVQLKDILWHWTALVESGKWDVDQNGVIGGIEKWREADTEEHCQDYLLPYTW